MKSNFRRCRYVMFTMLILASLCVMAHAEAPGGQGTPDAQETPQKVMYLTFDDGPTPGVTEDLLDALKAKDVKATFFVVGKEIIDREAVLKRIYEEGHTIGLHTYTHQYKKIYQSPEVFIEEMEQVEAKINEVLGTDQDIKIIRFPGGSGGRLTQDFLDKLHAKGYLIYDWNVNLEDGVNPQLSPSAILENAKKCTRDTTARILLAHCTIANQTTAKALPSIIDYYKNEGYVFRQIDETTPQFYYPVKK